jgi:AraC family transcriptional regulator
MKARRQCCHRSNSPRSRRSTVLCLRHEGPVATIGQTFRTLMERLRCDENPALDQRIGICAHDPAVQGGFRYHAGIVGGSHALPADCVEPVRLDGGLYAVHRLVGPYALIAPTFRALYRGWLPQSGYALDNRPALELYRNPLAAGSQHACVTDLLIPIRKD